jgi:hypothetical protein
VLTACAPETTVPQGAADPSRPLDARERPDDTELIIIQIPPIR